MLSLLEQGRPLGCAGPGETRGVPGLDTSQPKVPNKNLKPLACFLPLSPVHIMMKRVTTRHLTGNIGISLFRCCARPLLNTKDILSALAELWLGSWGAGADHPYHPIASGRTVTSLKPWSKCPLPSTGAAALTVCWDRVTAVPISPCLSRLVREQVCG